MAITGNFRGTSQPRFQISKSGAKIFGTTTRPTDIEGPNAPVNGDIWINQSSNTLEVFENGAWKNIGATLAELNVADGTLILDSENNQVRSTADLLVAGTVTANEFVGNINFGSTTTDTIAEGIINQYFSDEKAINALQPVDDVLYVNKNGRDVWDGKTEYRAFYTISAAVESISPPYKPNFPDGADFLEGEKTEAAALLLANKSFIQEEVVAYVLAEETFRYNRAKCERDTGFIVDALALDLTLGTNYNSVTVGNAYRRGNSAYVLSDQINQTLDAIDFIRDTIIALGISSTSRTTITNLTAEIKDIIQNNTPDTITYAASPAAIQAEINAKDQLQNNKSLIQTDIISYINTNYPGLTYDEAKCSRDVGYIIDALSFDILYGGNYASRIVADSYFEGVASLLGSTDEVTATIAAYQQLQTIVSSVVQETYAGQDTSAGAATNTEATQLSNLLQITIDVINEGNISSIPSLNEPDFTGITLTDYNLIDDNKANIQIDTVRFVDETYPRLMDSELAFAKCKRDTGYIVDALIEDLIRGGSQFSESAGLSYYNGAASYLPADQVQPTANAINHIGTVAANVILNVAHSPVYQSTVTQTINNGLTAEAGSGNNISTLITGIKNTITDPALSKGAIIRGNFDIHTELNPGGFTNAAEILRLNKEFIQEEVITYVDNNYADLLDTDQRTLCKRDTGFIVDALANDLELGGARRSSAAAVMYYNANSESILPTNQVTPTVNSIAYIKTLADDILRNAAVTSPLQTTVAQVINTSYIPEYDANNYLDRLVDSITRTIQTPKVYAQPYVIANFSPEAGNNPGGFDDAAALLQKNRKFIQEEVVAYVLRNERLNYDKVKCSRDTGYIIDAVTLDLALGTNYNSITAGLAYRRGVIGSEFVLREQKSQTINAIEYLRDQILALAIDEQSADIIRLRINDIVDIIRDNKRDDPYYTIPEQVSQNVINAFAQLRANREVIKDAVMSYLDTEYAALDYDKIACKRDVGFVVDGLSHDLLYGGNHAMRIVADSYYENAVVILGKLERIPTRDAYEQLKTIVSQVVQGTLAGQDTTNNNATATEASTLTGLISIITNVLDNDTVDVIPALQLPVLTWVDAPFLADYNTIVAQKATLQSDVITYVDSTYDTPANVFIYDSEKCRRDTGFIVDAITLDLALDSNYNSLTAGNSYRRGVAGSQYVLNNQNTQTIAAINYIGEVINNLDINVNSKITVNDRIADIIDVIQNDNYSAANIVYTTPGGSVTQSQLDAHAQLVNNRDFIRSELITYINTNEFQGFDANVCARDTGYIIDAVTYDLALGTNYNTVTAGLAYQRANSAYVISDQKDATKAAIRYLETLMTSLDIDAASVTELNASFDEIIDIIDNGLVSTTQSADTLVFDIPSTATAAEIAAHRQLRNNKALIQADIITFIGENYPALVYDETKCSRDVGFIIDALCHDILYGGNFASRIVADAYYEGSNIQIGAGEVTATVAAFTELQNIVANVVVETYNSQDIIADAATATEATTLRNLVQITIDVLEAGNVSGIPALVAPDLSGVTEPTATDYTTIVNEKATLQSSVVTYAQTNYPTTYDEAKCSRDVGFIIDGLAFDILYGGNVAATIIADSYYEGSNVLLGSDGERLATISAYGQLQNIISNVVIENYPGQDTTAGAANQTEADRLSDLLQITIDTISAGTKEYLPLRGDLPDLTWVDATTLADYNTIATDRAVIQDKTISFVDGKYLGLLDTQELNNCKRDTGHIVDALVEDLTNGGYESMKEAALFYYSGAVSILPKDQVTPTTNAISYIATLSNSIIYNTQIDANSLYSSATQIIDTTLEGEAAAQQNVEYLIQGMNTTITDAKPRRVVIKVAAGDYTVINPVKLPPNTAIFGDGLRSTSIRPKYLNQDIFHMDDGTYITGVTFRDHVAPSAAVAYNSAVKDDVRPFISTSPYVQNCTSRTTTGTGMRIDGAAVRGDIRSMVVDSYTQYNEGGVGIHILNRGYAQLVSVFTICCDDGFLCESGGQTSITNSNSSFGTRALKATGVSDTLYAGTVQANANINGTKTVTITNMYEIPKVSDAVKFEGVTQYFTVDRAERIDDTTCNVTLIESITANNTVQPGANVTFHQRSLIVASSHTFEYVGSGNNIANCLPSLGGVPNPSNEGVNDSDNGGKVFFTATNERGDFSVSGQFIINQNTGTVSGRTFNKSLFAVMTPYILALQD